MNVSRTASVFFVSTMVAVGLVAQDETSAQEQTSAEEKTNEESQLGSFHEEMVTLGRRSTSDLTKIDPETEKLLGIAGAGEDPLQAIFSLPSVTFSDDGDPVIRGSAPRDNAYYIDFLPASKIYHILGQSIFNRYVIQDFDLYPAAFSSRYGNATGGVIDVRLRDPANQPLTTTLSASLLQSALLVESGLGENQAFYISVRESMIDKLFDEDTFSEEEEGFIVEEMPAARDYQAKYLWTPSAQHTVTLVAAGASDDVEAELTDNSNEVQVDPDYAGPIDYTEAFDSQGLVWNWYSKGGEQELRTTFTNSEEQEDLYFGAGQFFNLNEQGQALRVDYLHQIGAHQLGGGLLTEAAEYEIDAQLKFVNCSDFDPDCPTVDVAIVPYQTEVEVQSVAAYIEDRWELADSHLLTLGVHYSDDDYLEDREIEPRLRWDMTLGEDWSTYVAVGKYSQLPDLEYILEDIGNPNLTRVKANHYVWGLENQWSENWHWQVDLYYKEINDLVISVTDPDAPEYDLSYTNEAEGTAYGAEFLLTKSFSHRWDGWLGLSLGKAERTDLRADETIPFDYDRPVMLDLVVNYRPGSNWKLGWKWRYQTGDRYTAIVDAVPNANDPDILEPVYGERNAYTTPDYHRLDFRAEYTKPTDWGHWSFFADIINVYGRENVSGYEFAPNGVDVLEEQPEGFGDNVPVRTEVSAGAIPSLGFEIQF